jgi:hypothetical protein
MAKIEDIERRLLNWARWRAGAGAGGMGYSAVNLESAGGSGGYREATIPTLDCEAEQTDRAVASLVSEIRATLELVYLGRGTMAEKARRLCIGEAMVYRRIDAAHLFIQRWLADLAQVGKRQRERMEALQRSARP